MKRVVLFCTYVASVLFLTAPVTGNTDASNDAPFTTCPNAQRHSNYEFQVRLKMGAFLGLSSQSILAERASMTLQSFVDLSNGSIVVSESPDEEIFKENSWYLTKPDGTPLPEDTAEERPYNTSSYVRTRQRQKIKDGELKDKVKIRSSLKIRGVDSTTFETPSGFSDDLDCDVHPDFYRTTYKIKVKDLDEAVVFATFDDVLKLFPFASQFFNMPAETALPERDFFVVHRFEWEDVEFRHAKMKCTFDLRFPEFESALTGTNPFAGEFSCSIDLEDILEASLDVADTLHALGSIFDPFQQFVDQTYDFPTTTICAEFI